jgi:AcrR family transcriptional regulator
MIELDAQMLDLFEIKPRKGDLKKMEIIQAAIECIANIGFEKTTYESIAQKLGTRRAHIKYYFNGKHEIFEACIKYIVANYHKILLDHIEKANTPKEMLMNYVEGPFIWARENPQQLSAMLLLYYFCTIRPNYRLMHHEIREKGAERIRYILAEKLKKHYTAEKALFLSKAIQNIMSGSILDASTTNGQSLIEAEAQAKKIVNKLL